MAKTTAPLFSMEASGSIGKTLVYSRWKGQPYCRRHVIPSNPQTANQIAPRNAMRVMAAGVTFAERTALVNSALTLTDKAELAAITPGGRAWNGFAVEKGIGSDLIDYQAATTAYAALQANEKTAWDTAAGALVPAIAATAQGDVGGGFGTPITSGATFFHWVYALYKAGLVSVPGAVPPTYA